VRDQGKVRGLRLKLIIAAVAILAGIFVYFAPTLYAGATPGFPIPGKLGPYISVRSVPDPVFACLLAALMVLALWRSRTGTKARSPQTQASLVAMTVRR